MNCNGQVEKREEKIATYEFIMYTREEGGISFSGNCIGENYIY